MLVPGAIEHLTLTYSQCAECVPRSHSQSRTPLLSWYTNSCFSQSLSPYVQGLNHASNSMHIWHKKNKSRVWFLRVILKGQHEGLFNCYLQTNMNQRNRAGLTVSHRMLWSDLKSSFSQKSQLLFPSTVLILRSLWDILRFTQRGSFPAKALFIWELLKGSWLQFKKKTHKKT